MGRSTRYRAKFLDPDGDRYGIPTFPWQSAPDGYATARQLRADGLRPGGQPVAAQILWRGIGGTRVAYLYRVADAKPKRTATPAQREAIERALNARRRCPTCHRVCPYFIPITLGECLDCAPDPHPNHYRDQHEVEQGGEPNTDARAAARHGFQQHDENDEDDNEERWAA